MTQLVDYLIEQKGISSDFIDAWGKPAKIKPENQYKLLEAMGYSMQDEQMLAEQLESEAVEYWLQALPSVLVLRKGDSVKIKARVCISDAAKAHTFKISLENGNTLSHKVTPVDAKLLATENIEGLEWHEYEIELPKITILGYHQISMYCGRKCVSQCKLIIAPKACYMPKAIKSGEKAWGLSVQLYCLRSRRNWGVGDFTDLISLVKQAAAKGADFIGLNPIHALFPANPNACSPYGPSSRQWLNYLYIDVEAVVGFDHKLVKEWWFDNDIPQKIETLRASDFVNYEGVAEVKLKALSLIFEEFDKTYLQRQNKQKKQFDKFVEEGGDSLRSQAIFESLQIHLKDQGKDYWGWPVFPVEYQDINNKSVLVFAKKYAKKVKFHLFLQWQAALQFEAASRAAKYAGMSIGLYKDLAVGVSEGGAEIWGNKELYCTQVSVGAPPDILGPLGQKWGLPPMDPEQLQKQQYQPIIDLFSSNMKGTGALRIDHVMALLRLWWVHKEDDASDGVYVNYPVNDLLAILALESVRNKSLVIGEDLGTVPDAIREKLHGNGMYSYRVFFFEQAEDGGFYSPSHYPEQSMSTLTTHDMPTLIGFWHCDDLSLGKEVGLYPDQEVLSNLYNIRHENKQHILNTLHGHSAISKNISTDVNYVGMTSELNFGMQTHMATGSSALLSLQLEDWLQMDKPVNIPGTFNEYPNWQRKLSHNIEDIFDRPEIVRLTKELTTRRRQASQKALKEVT
ncbi:4-alpha-glucanotransferase [Glaciecola petra]|uniref:4-alpha-glucanotransferase n=1 Tax=Glaciecola petra TaxID=3075602 RepID=A0ABU2ZNR0_9ALTE|nr:4-alpha-glucanotransferase [Aestuariibacter sp. P117]MDT0594035.1 4-alpha-glucanotransferase [Aestuariibacter sp. P117]